MAQEAADVADVRSNAQFFDTLVSLVPPRFYKGNEGESYNVKYMKRDDRAAAKLLMKEQRKANKRAKLDPDAKPAPPANAPINKLLGSEDDNDQDDEAGPSSSGDSENEDGEDGNAGSKKRRRQQRNKPANQGKDGSAGPSISLAAANASGTISLTASVSREELRQRLQRKLEAIREQRNAGGKDKVAQGAKEWRDKALAENARNRISAKDQQADRKKQKPGLKQKQQQPSVGQDSKVGGAAAATLMPAISASEFKFGRVETETVIAGTRAAQQQRRAPTAMLLKQAEAKQRELEELKSTEEGKSKLRGAAWSSALQRARGDKVLDDPKLLRRTLKKEAKLAKKSSAQWKERESREAGRQSQKQQKRAGNLQARVNTKLDAKKARREKKLLGGKKGGGGAAAAGASAAQRPGFEGRKAGFIGRPAVAVVPKA